MRRTWVAVCLAAVVSSRWLPAARPEPAAGGPAPNQPSTARREPRGISLEIGGRALIFHGRIKSVRSGTRAYQRGDIVQATILFNNALDEDPGNYEALYYLGRIARDRKQTDTAVKLFTRAAAANPESADPHISLGCLYYFDRDNTGQAMEHFNRARTIDPKNGRTYYMLGIISHDRGNMASAETYYRQALRLELGESTKLEIRRIMVRILLEREDFPELEAQLSAVAENYPEQAGEPIFRKARGIVLIQNKRFWDAQQELQAADKDLPRDGEIHFWLGIALYHRNRLDKATVHLARATVYNPSNGEAHYRLARLYETRGDYEEALRSYDAALRNGFTGDAPEAIDDEIIRLRAYLQHWRNSRKARDRELE